MGHSTQACGLFLLGEGGFAERFHKSLSSVCVEGIRFVMAYRQIVLSYCGETGRVPCSAPIQHIAAETARQQASTALDAKSRSLSVVVSQEEGRSLQPHFPAPS